MKATCLGMFILVSSTIVFAQNGYYRSNDAYDSIRRNDRDRAARDWADQDRYDREKREKEKAEHEQSLKTFTDKQKRLMGIVKEFLSKETMNNNDKLIFLLDRLLDPAFMYKLFYGMNDRTSAVYLKTYEASKLKGNQNPDIKKEFYVTLLTEALKKFDITDDKDKNTLFFLKDLIKQAFKDDKWEQIEKNLPSEWMSADQKNDFSTALMDQSSLAAAFSPSQTASYPELKKLLALKNVDPLRLLAQSILDFVKFHGEQIVRYDAAQKQGVSSLVDTQNAPSFFAFMDLKLKEFVQKYERAIREAKKDANVLKQIVDAYKISVKGHIPIVVEPLYATLLGMPNPLLIQKVQAGYKVPFEDVYTKFKLAHQKNPNLVLDPAIVSLLGIQILAMLSKTDMNGLPLDAKEFQKRAAQALNSMALEFKEINPVNAVVKSLFEGVTLHLTNNTKQPVIFGLLIVDLINELSFTPEQKNAVIKDVLLLFKELNITEQDLEAYKNLKKKNADLVTALTTYDPSKSIYPFILAEEQTSNSAPQTVVQPNQQNAQNNSPVGSIVNNVLGSIFGKNG